MDKYYFSMLRESVGIMRGLGIDIRDRNNILKPAYNCLGRLRDMPEHLVVGLREIKKIGKEREDARALIDRIFCGDFKSEVEVVQYIRS